MGYYTTFDLTVNHVMSGMRDQLLKDLDNLCVFNDTASVGSRVYASGYAKWYEWETDLLQLSVQYPGCFFELTGDGEDIEDRWKAYFENGKTCTCQSIIQYEPFLQENMVQKIPAAECYETGVELEDLI